MRRLAGIGLVAGIVVTPIACTTITEDLPARPTEIVEPTPIFVPPPPNPSPTQTPAPNPAPTPRPPASPPPNSSNVVKLFIKVEQVTCNGQKVPNSEFASSAKVGCQIQFDATAKDAANKPTTPDGDLHWSYQPSSLVDKVNEKDNWAPILTGGAPGVISVNATVDGVQSQSLRIQLYN